MCPSAGRGTDMQVNRVAREAGSRPVGGQGVGVGVMGEMGVPLAGNWQADDMTLAGA